MIRMAPALALVVVLSGGTVPADPAGADAEVPDPKGIQRAARMYQRGQRALAAHRLEQACASFERALAIAPGFPQAELGLGHVAMLERDFDAALAHYRTAKRGYAAYGEATLELEARRYAKAQDQIGVLWDSIDQLRSAVRSSRGPANANIRIARLENAIQQLEAIRPPDPSRATRPPAELDFYIGNAQFQIGNLDDAIASWEECARKNSGFAIVHNNLALGYWKKGELDRAQESLARAEELGFPVNPHFKSDLEAATGVSGR